ncbi:MAG TPA: FtsX-like permease family protein, partial [Candidatus Eremiobacteraeota bacterium]|nr:FtsX-like permease family protein [Candidatus Eremiobacteraeota bacterium]
VTNMTRAFNLNLTALSTLALIVGMFLIYNTMTFSVVQRRTMIGMLRAVGVTRGEIFRLILGEALFIGICGTITGIVTGIFMGKGMVTLVTNAINDIYFVLSVTNITISYLTILKAIGLGICATLIAALLPALEATSAPPRTVISRSTIEIGSRGRLLLEALAGLLLLICATGLIFFSERDLIFSIGSMFIITIGFALLTPIITVIFTGLLKPITGYLFGIPGRMSASGITSSLSRTAVAIAALMIALSVTVSVGIMVASLRYAVIVWMETFLKADIYISPPALVYSRSDLLIDPHLVKLLSEADGISSVTTYRGVMIESDRGLNQLIAITIDKETYSSFRFKEGNPANIWTVFEGQDSVIVSESYAYLHNSRIGSTITMLTNRGEKKFFIAGIFYDYTSDRGIIVINRKTYEKYWYDRNISSLAIYTKKGVNTDDLINKLREIAGPHQEIIIQSNRSLREVTLQVFDRTFIITDVLRILSIIVAFIGVLSALMALQLERAREIAVLRATGLTPGQVWKIIIIQTALMGIIAGVMALILGIVIAIVLIFVINRRSFGWTMEMVIPQAILVQSFFLAITASILAGIYPAMKMAGTSPAAALREE